MVECTTEVKHIDFIINPVSGAKDKRKIVSIIEKELDANKFTHSFLFTTGPGHATLLASESEADIVCAVGGDGTLNEVAKGLLGTDKVFALIPCGSGDGLAICLGISRNPRKAVRNLNEGVPRRIDSATINGREFFSICGTGLDAIVSYRFAQSVSRGLKTYILEAMHTWKGFVFEDYDITVDGVSRREKAALISVGNSNQWGNQARITPLADLSDGLLDLTIVSPFRTFDIPGIVIKLMTGHLDRSKKAICLKGRHITITKEGECISHYDGDPIKYGSSLDIRVVPSSINIIAPKQ